MWVWCGKPKLGLLESAGIPGNLQRIALQDARRETILPRNSFFLQNAYQHQQNHGIPPFCELRNYALTGWQRMPESNRRYRSQSPGPYRLANPPCSRSFPAVSVRKRKRSFGHLPHRCRGEWCGIRTSLPSAVLTDAHPHVLTTRIAASIGGGYSPKRL